MAVTPNLGLASPLISAVAGWIARIKSDFAIVDDALSGLGIASNILVNPGFGIDQRAGGPYSGNGVYSLDRWMISYTGGVTLTVTAENATVDANSRTSAKCVFALGGGSAATLEQLIETWPVLKGLTLTLRMRVKCSTANAVRVLINDGVTPTFSPYHTGGGGWETLTVTRTLDAAATTCKAAAYFSASCTAYLDNATLVYGSAALPFRPPRHEDDLLRCQRYYEVQGGSAGHPYLWGYAAAGAAVVTVSWPFATPKGGVPTVTRSGTWTKSNCAADPAVSNANANGYSLSITATAGGSLEATPNNATVTAEWNAV